ncbi:hypothetical protein PtB15_14B308 [Puccinia triticina]|nr:hypothetical protein PtB15_14B308 [Puccinia triticina]
MAPMNTYWQLLADSLSEWRERASGGSRATQLPPARPPSAPAAPLPAASPPARTPSPQLSATPQFSSPARAHAGAAADPLRPGPGPSGPPGPSSPAGSSPRRLVEQLETLAEQASVPHSVVACLRRLKASIHKRRRAPDADEESERRAKAPRTQPVFADGNAALAGYARVLSPAQAAAALPNIRAILAIIIANRPPHTPAPSTAGARLTYRARGLSPMDWLKLVEQKCPDMYVFPNAHILAGNPCVDRPALEAAMNGRGAAAPWAEKLFVRFAHAFQAHRASSRLGLTQVVLRAVYLASPTAADEAGAPLDPLVAQYIDSAPFEQLYSCCQNLVAAITNLRGLTKAKDVSFAPLACYLSSGVRGVLFGPLKARYCPPSCAAQLFHMLTMLIDRDVALPQETFWTRTQALLHDRISQALSAPTVIGPLPRADLARALSADFLQGWSRAGESSFDLVHLPQPYKPDSSFVSNLKRLLAQPESDSRSLILQTSPPSNPKTAPSSQPSAMAFSLQLISMVMMVCVLSVRETVGHPFGIPSGRPMAPQGTAATRDPVHLSPSCQVAASALLGGEVSRCANMFGLASIFEAKESLVSPINDWVSGACAASPCSKQALASASHAIKTECASDLQEGAIAAVAMYSILTHYDVTRDMFCTQYTQNSAFCLPSVLGDVEAQSGEKITLGEVVSLISGKLTEADRAFMAVPKATYCTPCAHAIVTKSATMIDAIRAHPAGIPFDYTPTSAVHQISEICGRAFEDHKLPGAVRVAAFPKTGAPGGPAADNYLA